MLRTAYGKKFFSANQWYRWKTYTPTRQMSTALNREPQTRKNGSRKFISSLLFPVRLLKSLNSTVKLLFISEQNGANRYRQNTICMVGSGPNENGYCQKNAFAAWPYQIDARHHYRFLSCVLVYSRG